MNMLFLKWEEDMLEVPQALFSNGSGVVAFSWAELAETLAHLYNTGWLAAVETALATHPSCYRLGLT
jgi:hypothetical protein